MIAGGALLLDRVAKSHIHHLAPRRGVSGGAPIGLERVLPRVDVALRPPWPAFKANPPRFAPPSFLLPQIPPNNGWSRGGQLP